MIRLMDNFQILGMWDTCLWLPVPQRQVGHCVSRCVHPNRPNQYLPVTVKKRSERCYHNLWGYEVVHLHIPPRRDQENRDILMGLLPASTFLE